MVQQVRHKRQNWPHTVANACWEDFVLQDERMVHHLVPKREAEDLCSHALIEKFSFFVRSLLFVKLYFLEK